MPTRKAKCTETLNVLFLILLHHSNCSGLYFLLSKQVKVCGCLFRIIGGFASGLDVQSLDLIFLALSFFHLTVSTLIFAYSREVTKLVHV